MPLISVQLGMKSSVGISTAVLGKGTKNFQLQLSLDLISAAVKPCSLPLVWVMTWAHQV